MTLCRARERKKMGKGGGSDSRARGGRVGVRPTARPGHSGHGWRGGDPDPAGAGGAVEQGKKERGRERRLAIGPPNGVGPTCQHRKERENDRWAPVGKNR
jgi:hypothetical protein